MRKLALALALLAAAGCSKVVLIDPAPTAAPTKPTQDRFRSAETARLSSEAKAQWLYEEHKKEFRDDAMRSIDQRISEGRSSVGVAVSGDGSEKDTVDELRAIGYKVEVQVDRVVISWK